MIIHRDNTNTASTVKEHSGFAREQIRGGGIKKRQEDKCKSY